MMRANRMEAFSDGVLAIIITIMVLELKIPEGVHWASLQPLIPKLLGYVLSFIYLGIYWNNHHHLIHTVREINGKVMWLNLNLLFWLSLVPFSTAWMGETRFAATPTALYGILLFMAAIAYWMLQHSILGQHDSESALSQAIGRDIKGNASVILYAAAIALAYVSVWLSSAIYALVALLWFIPDKRIEQALKQQN